MTGRYDERMAIASDNSAPDASTTWVARWPLDLVRVLAPLRRGRSDPCHAVVDGRVVWRTSRMASGTVVARLEQTGERTVRCEAWGSGAEEFVIGLPELLGGDDAPEEFDHLDHVLVRKLHLAHPWLRMPRTNRVFEALTSAVLEQRVTVEEAFSGRRWLLRVHGEAPPATPAAMPSGMRVVPDAAMWRTIPNWDWYRAGVDVTRAETLLRCAHVAGRLNEIAAMDRADGVRRLRAVRTAPRIPRARPREHLGF